MTDISPKHEEFVVGCKGFMAVALLDGSPSATQLWLKRMNINKDESLDYSLSD